MFVACSPENRRMSFSPLIDRRNLDFVLHELLDAKSLCDYPRFSEHGRETFDAAIAAAHDLALAKFAPHNRKADLDEPHLVDGHVRIIPEVKQALDAYAEAGFPAMMADAEDGGMQLPYTIALVCDAMFAAASVATAGYTMLAHGVANLLNVYGTPAQQALFMRPILQGRFLGTMCLSEPQAGSSLGDITTSATLHADGSYRISGAKMWISGGDHELSENIVHLVLAKIPGGPPGVKGISLFVVSRFRVNADGTLGARNDVQLAGVNHKMGQRGIVNTFLKFGERGECVGFLVGQAHQGLPQMFHMMNEARIGVGIGAIMLGSAGYLYSLDYAKERRQGRHPDQKDPASSPIALIEHADVRRMLLRQKAIVEGAFALAIHAATLVDIRNHDSDTAKRQEAQLLLEVLTPIVKAWSGEWCCKANDDALQILGGYGYTREYPVEQYYRDNRLNPIHEGANGIQAIDLLGRKAMLADGAALKLLWRELQSCIDEADTFPELREYSKSLADALASAVQTTDTLTACLARGEIRLGLANATHYLGLMGHLCIAWTWLRQAVVAQRALSTARPAEQAFYDGKLAACRYFFRYELPVVEPLAVVLQGLDATTLEMRPEWF
jgi:butyryl-CoA dehydrogenase